MEQQVIPGGMVAYGPSHAREPMLVGVVGSILTFADTVPGPAGPPPALWTTR